MDFYWKITFVTFLMTVVSGFIAAKKDTKYYRAACGACVLLFVILSIVGVALNAALAVSKVCG